MVHMCHVMVWCSREYPTSRDRYQDILADLPLNGETLWGKGCWVVYGLSLNEDFHPSKKSRIRAEPKQESFFVVSFFLKKLILNWKCVCFFPV